MKQRDQVTMTPATQLPAEPHDTEANRAAPPWFNDPRPGTSIAVPQVPAWATARAADAAVTGSGAAHHTAAAPATTIRTRCRRTGYPRHIPAGPADPVGTYPAA
jgi:hypothetical protein